MSATEAGLAAAWVVLNAGGPGEQRDTDQRYDDDLEADLDELFHDVLPCGVPNIFRKRCTSLPICVR